MLLGFPVLCHLLPELLHMPQRGGFVFLLRCTPTAPGSWTVCFLGVTFSGLYSP